MKTPIAAVVFLAVLSLAYTCAGQTLTGTIDPDETYNYQLDGKMLRFDFHSPGRTGFGNNSGEIDISELDLDAAEVGEIAALPGKYSAVLQCKQQTSCIQMQHSGGMHWSDEPAQGDLTRSYLDLNCNSQQACVDFLNAMKNAVAPGSANPRQAASAPQFNVPTHEPETVIDGSRIPSQIDFTKKQPPGAFSGPPAATITPAFEPLTPLFGAGNSTPAMAAQNGTDNLESFFNVEATTQEPTSGPSLASAENFAAGLFDQAREGKLESAADVFRYAVEEQLTDQYQEIVQNTVSYSFTGMSFDELPEDFQKDYAVWDAGFKRILEPFSLKGGLELVDAFGNLFDLWGNND